MFIPRICEIMDEILESPDRYSLFISYLGRIEEPGTHLKIKKLLEDVREDLDDRTLNEIEPEPFPEDEHAKNPGAA